MVTGIVICLPPILLPLLFPGSDASIPWHQRYTTKANVYIFILSWMANYFWTHYFYHVLGTAYTFDAWRLNDVPFALFLITHSYFHLYHVLSTIALRITWRKLGSGVTGYVGVTLLIVALSFFMAFAETFTIQNVRESESNRSRGERQAHSCDSALRMALSHILSLSL